MKKIFTIATITWLCTFMLVFQKSFANAVEDFYKDKKITVIVRSKAGGGYDTYARLVARHLGKHIPGNPDLIVQNMPGAGGIIAANYLNSRAPQDGTTIAIFDRTAALTQRIGKQGVEYDISTWNLLASVGGSVQTFVTRKDSPINSFSDLVNSTKQQLFSVSGIGSDSYHFVELLKIAGMPVKAITGYGGQQEKMLAIMRGEVTGSVASYTSIKDYIDRGDFKIIGAIGNLIDYQSVDQLENFIPESELSAFAITVLPLEAGRPFATTPNVPKERVEILRKAFKDLMSDKVFLQEAEKLELDINYVSAEKMSKLYRSILSSPDSVIEKSKLN